VHAQMELANIATTIKCPHVNVLKNKPCC